MIHLWAPCLANEFMPLSLGEEDLVIHKMMPLSAYLMLRWGRERNPCSASLLLDSPSSCLWCCKKPDHCLAPALFCSRAAVWSQSLWGQEKSQCAVENLTPWPFLRPGAAYSVTAQKLLPWPNLGMKWMEYPPLSFTKRLNKSEILAKTWWKEGWTVGQEMILHLWHGQGANPYGNKIPQMASNFAEGSLPSIPIYSWATSHHARAASLLWLRIPGLLPSTFTLIVGNWWILGWRRPKSKPVSQHKGQT